MKITKRDKNTIMTVFWFYILVFFTLLFYSITFFYPNIIEIENKKIDLIKLYENKVEIENKWITFADFVLLNKDTKDIYLKNVISNIDEKFYNDNFKNTWNWVFENFINSKIKDINSWESQNKLLLQNERIAKILPSYIEDSNWEEENILTNFRFINYIESILATFNLDSTDKIWITNIELLWDYEKIDWKNNNLEVNIFAFPLSFTIDWTKESIINFLYFAQNVWNIVISEKDDISLNEALSVYTDKWEEFLKTKFWKITLKGDPDYNELNYNIFENQIFNIDYIKFWEYINTYWSLRAKSNFSDFVKSTQWNEEYSIDVKLYFYVKWIQQYELIAYMSTIIEKYFVLNKEVSNKLKDVNMSKYDLVKFKQANSYLNEINKEIQNLKKELLKKENLEQLYGKVIKYNASFTQIEKLIK